MTPADLAASHVNLVYTAARQQKRLRPFDDYDELVGDGMVGLMQAAQRFDPSTGATFAGFAAARISGAMLDGFRRRYPTGHNHNAGAPFLEFGTLDGVPDPLMGSAESEALDRFALARLLEQIAAMPPHLREVVGLLAEGAAFRPVAERDGVSVSAISQRAITARRWLNRCGPPVSGPNAKRAA